jgi:pimeloyl-ACP methyl ester carboxylesterase
MHTQDLYIQVDGVRTRYWEFGDSGSPVLFIHGLGSCIEHWENNLAAFSKHHHVYAIDLIGFGLTEKPSIPYSSHFLAKFVQGFIKAKGIKSASLIGNSLGCMIAIELYLLDPASVDKLILLDGGYFAREISIAFRILSLPMIGEWLMRPKRDGTKEFLKLMFFDPAFVTDELVDTTFERNALPGSSKAYLRTLRSVVNFFGLKQALVKRMLQNKDLFTVPTLVIWGENDNVLPVEHAHKAAEILPNATLHIFDQCGHMPQIECAEEFNDLSINFLSQ